jgi:phosphatidate cytidylyltransferase
MLLPRVLTAIVGIPFLIFLMHHGGLAYTAFIGAICALALYEYGLILKVGGRPCQRLITAAGGTFLALTLALGGPIGLVFTALVAAMVLREMSMREHSLDRLALSLFGAVFLGWMLGHLALIRDLKPHGEKLTYLLFVTVWVMDSAAYFVGKAFGKHPLASVLSPKKTWEGAAAGFAGAVLFILSFRALALRDSLSVAQALGLAALIGVSGQLSDLAESMVKRAVGVKDSGTLLPGHGGIMDRFDSFILAAPIVYYYVSLL